MSKSKKRAPDLMRSLASIAVAPLVLLPVSVAVNAREMLFAQAPNGVPVFQLPGSLPSGTTVKVNGSSGMRATNEALKQRFESRFSGTRVELAADGSDAALKALTEGKIDIAAIGRLLTDAERAQGLQQVPVSREKIAIIVGSQNPFKGSLTAEQFAKIFRGEITNWAQLGGPNVAIRFVDRPAFSDTRQSLSYYPVFQSAPFQTGATAAQVANDDTAAIVKELRTDGISYAPVSQVANQPNVQILPMHDTLPTDPRYPYSQPRTYVYKGNPNPGILAFLGFATSVPGQESVSAGLAPQTAAPADSSATAPTGTAPTGTAPTGTDLTGAASTTAAGTIPGGAAATSPAGTDAAATTAAGAAETAPAGTTPDGINPAAQTTDPATGTDSATLPGSTSDTAAAASGKSAVGLSRFWWLLLPLLGLPLLLWFLRGKGGAVPPVVAAPERQGRLILTPRDCRNAYAYWEIPEAQLSEARRQGGRDLKVRLYDVTDVADLDRQAAHSMKEFDCAEDAQDLHLPIAADDRDYLAELGYATTDDRWIRLARSGQVRVPACTPNNNGTIDNDTIDNGTIDNGTIGNSKKLTAVGGTAPEMAAGGVLAAGAAAGGILAAGAAAGAAARSLTPANRTVQPSRMILVPRTPESIYAYWEVPESRKAELKQQGGQQLLMRLQDITADADANPETRPVRYFECDEQLSDLRLPTTPNRSYVAELGYRTQDNRWLGLVRSAPVHVPPDVQGTFKPVKRPIVEEVAKPAVPNPSEEKTALLGRVGDRTGETPNTVGDAQMGTANLLEKVSQRASALAGSTTTALGTAIAGGTAAVAGVSLGAKSLWDRQSDKTEPVPEIPQVCRIILVARSSQDAYAYWEISESYKQPLREQGGTRLMLRVHDATNLDIDHQPPHSTQEYVCQETAMDQHVPIWVSDRDYIAEIGYYTEDDRWLRLIRSFHVHVPAES